MNIKSELKLNEIEEPSAQYCSNDLRDFTQKVQFYQFLISFLSFFGDFLFCLELFHRINKVIQVWNVMGE